MRKLLIGAAVALPLAVLPAAVMPAGSLASGAAPARPELAKLVTLKDIVAHLEAFQEIADYNGGNRASGGAGYDVSVRYVAGRLRKAGLTPKIQKFAYPFWRERSRAVLARTAPSKASYRHGKDFATFAYSGSGNVTARAVAVDVPSKGEGTSGCEKGDFKGFTRGSIALVQRGTCTFAVKAANARAAGASAVVIYNKPGEQGLLNGTVGKPAGIPVVGTSRTVGAALAKTAKKGGLMLRVRTDTVHGKRRSSNVIADTGRGRSDNVVLLGAHLDSVPEGAGINDNATGAAALLAIAAKIEHLGKDGLRNRVRFAWWGAEEEGLRGSRHYVKSLSRANREKIAVALNFDMLGSRNGTRGVYDGDHSTRAGTRAPAGSGAIEKMFRDYFKSRRLPTTEHAFSGRSDYGPFIEAGIASGGMATGADGVKTAAEAKAFGGRAGKVYDPCYHAKCDRLKNVNRKLLDTNADGIAHVAQHLARTTVAVNGGARLTVGGVPSSSAPAWQGPYRLR
ncbi:M20/M25/M40 family metallo-hydrolase [Actinomadura sp. KC06]|uniref:M20/M25/M40 family metallo-hydrolase n=1 Tax=Actinomadura sp. KC06 TaxID=2530369 RepID=UPI001FB6C030|nr:M20/M25/M40 family metallo-hydrolase [Actinomadura sp. KC06]